MIAQWLTKLNLHGPNWGGELNAPIEAATALQLWMNMQMPVFLLWIIWFGSNKNQNTKMIWSFMSGSNTHPSSRKDLGGT